MSSLSVGWTSYNHPTIVAGGGEYAQFSYKHDHTRWSTNYSGSAGQETTYFIGDVLEKVITSGVNDYRHYIYAGGAKVAIYSRTSTGVNSLHYVREDHLGGVSSLVNSNGTPYVKESFTAFGARRSGATWSGPPSAGDLQNINAVTRHGFTWHTALGTMGLNDMNGRIQDAVTGRFLSADPTIPPPLFTQDFNRYSYVNNNPLTFADPSGFQGISPFVKCNDCSDGANGGLDTDPDTGWPTENGVERIDVQGHRPAPADGGLNTFRDIFGNLPGAGPQSFVDGGVGGSGKAATKSPPQKDQCSSTFVCRPPPVPCLGMGHAPTPQQFAAQGQADAQSLENTESTAGFDPSGVPSFGLGPMLASTAAFHRGGAFDAQAYGASTPYANYVYGVYASAAGWSLSFTLTGANTYAFVAGRYAANVPMSPAYPSTPAVNVSNITAGFNDEQNGTLCVAQ